MELLFDDISGECRSIIESIGTTMAIVSSGMINRAVVAEGNLNTIVVSSCSTTV